MNEKVSVIIPTYNREKLIVKSINSVLNQTYGNVEVIVVDDGSTDNTENILKKINDDRLHYYKIKNGGACKARNFGILKSTGKYITFLDSDDEYKVNKIEKQLSYLKKNNADIVFCNYEYEKKGMKKIVLNIEHKKVFKKQDMLDKNYITTSSLMCTKKIIENVGGFDELMPRYQDWELVLRLSNEYDFLYQNDSLINIYYQDESITNSTSKEKKMYALERIFEKNRNDYLKNKKAYSHIMWSIGMYSLFTSEIKFDCLKIGVFGNHINFKRLLIYVLIKIGFKRIIMEKYGENH